MFENAAFLLAFHDRDDVLLTLPVKTTLFFGERTMKLFSAKSANRKRSNIADDPIVQPTAGIRFFRRVRAEGQ